MLAPPPIQLPASVAMPAQVSPAMVCGAMARMLIKANAAPKIMLTDVAAYIANNLGPNLRMAFKSTAMVNSTNAAGNSTRLATGLYSLLCAPSIRPMEL